jgi:hypothetical protein
MTRRIAVALCLALALLLGEHAAALHDLGHATERLSQKKDSHPVPASCEKCFACAELSGALRAATLSVPLVPAGGPIAPVVLEAGVRFAPRLAFRSHAPPRSL